MLFRKSIDQPVLASDSQNRYPSTAQPSSSTPCSRPSRSCEVLTSTVVVSSTKFCNNANARKEYRRNEVKNKDNAVVHCWKFCTQGDQGRKSRQSAARAARGRAPSKGNGQGWEWKQRNGRRARLGVGRIKENPGRLSSGLFVRRTGVIVYQPGDGRGGVLGVGSHFGGVCAR